MIRAAAIGSIRARSFGAINLKSACGSSLHLYTPTASLPCVGNPPQQSCHNHQHLPTLQLSARNYSRGNYYEAKLGSNASTASMRRPAPPVHMGHDEEEEEPVLDEKKGEDIDLFLNPGGSLKKKRQRWSNPMPTKGGPRVKVWNNPDRSVQARVKALMQAKKIHPADISAPMAKGVSGSAMENLVAACCKRNNLEGMHLGQYVIDRLLVEKQRVKKDNRISGRGAEHDIILPIALWDKLLFGWTQLLVLRNKHNRTKVAVVVPSQAVERMREIVSQAIEEAQLDDEESMTDYQESKIHSSRPNTAFLNTYLYGLSLAAQRQKEQQDKDGASAEDAKMVHKAQEFLHEMIYLSKSRNGWYTRPNTKSYMFVMQIIANCGLSNEGYGIQHRGVLAQNFLDHIRGLDKQIRRRHLEDEDLQTFNGLVESDPIVSSKEIDAEDTGLAVSADKQLYTSCLVAMAKSIGRNDGIVLDDVFRIVRQVIQMEKEADDAWEWEAMKRKRSNEGDENSLPEYLDICDGSFVAMAFKTMSNMMQHDTQIRGDKKQRIALGQTSENLLHEILGHWKERHIRRLKQRLDGDAEATKIDADSIRMAYNGCMDVWARSDTEQAAPKCEAILLSMLPKSVAKRLMVKDGVDRATKTMLAKHLDSISKSIIDSGIESVDMLVEPDAVSFNSALYGWSRSHAFHSDVAASRAVELLDFQQALADVTQNAKSAPDTQSFTIAILAQRGASTSTRAGLKISLEIFQRWLATIEMRSPIRTEHEPDGNASDGPKQQEDLLIHPFSALLSLIYNIPSSVDKQSPKRSRGEHLQHDSMRQLFEFSGEEKDNGTEDFSKPDLDLIAEKSDLYEVALQVYQAGVNDSLKLGAHLQPNHHFYSAFLSCLEKHCHPTSVELKTMTEQVWLDARESGQVSRIVWPKILNLCRHLDGGLYRLLGDDVEHFTQEEMSLYTSRRNRNNKNPRRERARARVSNLPRYWWRNVPPSWK